MAKAAGTLQASTSVAAGSTQTSSAMNLTTYQGPTVVFMTITNGATPPATKCVGSLEASADGSTNWEPIFSYQSDLTASAAYYSGGIELSPGYMYIRSVFTGHTTQAVTVVARTQSQTS